jgi:hypothetical protein
MHARWLGELFRPSTAAGSGARSSTGQRRSAGPRLGSVKAVQAQLGHASATITLDRYGHLFPDELAQLAGTWTAPTRKRSRTQHGPKLLPEPPRNAKSLVSDQALVVVG